ncbi:MAG: flippase-like domain-containing protein [Candidatus Accumulibacter phosphatis]|nr:flippase-like domain-containing protein [Candidatus Accumulibacter phosphatis]
MVFGGALFGICCWYLYSRFQWKQVEIALKGVDLLLFIVGGSGSILAYFFLRTLRWLVMVRTVHANARLSELYLVVAISLGFSLLTPGQLGESMKVELLKRRGLLGRVPGLGSFLIERALDAVILSVLAMLALLGGANILHGYQGLRWVALGLFFAGIVLLTAIMLLRPQGAIGRLFENLRSASGSMREIGIVGFLTLLAWLVIVFGWQISLYSVDVQLTFVDALWLMCVVAVAQIMSFIPGGLGISEVITIDMIQSFGFNEQAAIASATVLRLYGLLTILVSALHLPMLVLDNWRTRALARVQDT